MKEKFIVLGAVGHIGFNVVKKLVSMKKNVKVLLNNKKYENKLPNNIEIFYGDISKKDSLKEIFKNEKKNILYVINCVNYYSTEENDNKKIYTTSVVGNKNILESCVINNVDKYVYISSYEAFLNEVSYFGECKKIALDDINEYENKLNISTIIPTMFIGPYDYRGNIINNYLYNFYLGNLRSFVKENISILDVRDIADAAINAALYGKPSKKYFLNSSDMNTEYLINEFAKMCEVKKIRKFYSLEQLYKKENMMKKICEYKKIKPYYNKNLLKCLEKTLFDSSDSCKDLYFSPRNILETLNDTKLFFDSVKK